MHSPSSPHATGAADMMYFVYIGAICAANFSVSVFGPWATPINAFVLIGLDFVIRDKLHERIGVQKIFILIVVAGVISYAINPATGKIASASVVAFAFAALVDAVVYQLLINQKWLVKSNISNTAASAVDSFIFPLIAFGAFMPLVVLGQFAAKVIGGATWSLLLRKVK